jgi:hypothetical protein
MSPRRSQTAWSNLLCCLKPLPRLGRPFACSLLMPCSAWWPESGRTNGQIDIITSPNLKPCKYPTIFCVSSLSCESKASLRTYHGCQPIQWHMQAKTTGLREWVHHSVSTMPSHILRPVTCSNKPCQLYQLPRSTRK